MKEIRLTWDKATGAFRRKSKRTPNEKFLRGPVPWWWLTSAARLPGGALTVGVVLWQLAGLRGTRQQLSLSNERLEPLGVLPDAKDRALRALLKAGLVTVERKAGRSPRVSLVVKR